FRWTPVPEVLLRGSYGTGFRAPSLTDLYTPQQSSVTANGSRDPLRCPNVQTGAPADCNNQFPTTTGGNPALQPEK
ncbi:MAG: TonB-dependent receptor, partial [Usitatibacter sp.]